MLAALASMAGWGVICSMAALLWLEWGANAPGLFCANVTLSFLAPVAMGYLMRRLDERSSYQQQSE